MMGNKEKDDNSILMRVLLNPKGKSKYIYALISFTIVVILTVLLYLVPDYYFLEKITNDTVFEVLKVYQFDVVFDGFYSERDTDGTFIVTIVNILTGLDGHNALTPVIKSTTASGRRFAVVRACTGMQAGALLMALIIVTPADFGKKVKATAYSLIALIVGNFLRIALVIGMTVTLQVTYGTGHDQAWMWAHDVIGKPIGFFGTIFFAIIIEKQGVPILNTVSIWIDSLFDFFSFIAVKLGFSKKQQKVTTEAKTSKKIEIKKPPP
jgi:exosortase/archaeosortase family protein